MLDHDSRIDGHRQTYTFQPRTPSHVSPGESDSEDDLNENWLGNNYESKVQTETHPTSEKDSMEGDPSVEVRHGHEASEFPASTNPVASKGVLDQDDHMVESPQNRNNQIVDGALPYTTASDDELEPLRKKVALSTIEVTDNIDTVARGSELKVSTSELVLQGSKDGVASIIDRISATLSNTEKMAGIFEPDNELSEDVFPDIVDTDPDSD